MYIIGDVCKANGVVWKPDDPVVDGLAQAFTTECDEKPSDNEQLAEAGFKMWYYTKPKHHSCLSATAKVADKDEFAEQQKLLDESCKSPLGGSSSVRIGRRGEEKQKSLSGTSPQKRTRARTRRRTRKISRTTSNARKKSPERNCILI